TSYVMMPQRNVFDPLSSSFETTPSVATRKLRLSSQRRINPQLLSSAVYHDFLGTIPNSKYKANSLLFGHNNDAYVECDPRKTSTSMVSWLSMRVFVCCALRWDGCDDVIRVNFFLAKYADLPGHR